MIKDKNRISVGILEVLIGTKLQVREAFIKINAGPSFEVLKSYYDDCMADK